MRLLNDTRFVVPFFLFIIGILSFLLYLNLTSTLGGSDSPTIGVLTFKTKTVLRKFNDQVVWDSIESSSEVKNRDTIRTEGLSDAVLTLNDGTKINISENSMILLDISDKNINVNFAYGSFEAAREGTGNTDVKMNITAGDKVVEVGKGDIKLDKTKDELNVKVGEGEAKITANGKQETIAKDEVASVSSQGVKVSKPKFGLTSPEDKKLILSETGSEMINFNVSGVTPEILKATNANIEVSLFPDFSKSVIKEKLRSGSLSRSLTSGSYHWRIVFIDPETKDKQTSETFKFKIISNPGLRLFLPKDGDNFSYTSEVPVIKVSWGNLELYSSYTAQVAKDPGFSSELKTKQTQNQAISFESLPDGTYYARVIARSNLPDVPEKISSVSRFTVGRKLNQEPPALVEPSKDKVFSKEQIENNIFFSWKDTKDFESFQFELSEDKTFTKILYKAISENSFLKYGSDLQSGTYFWRVRGRTPGKEDILSAIFNFSVVAKEDLDLLSPTNGSEATVTEKGNLLLRWKKLSSKASYKLEISKSNDFQSLMISESGSNTFAEIKPKEFGKLFWRVLAETKNGNVTSEIWNFTVNSSMEPPVLVSPLKNENIDISNKSNITFSWKAQEKASAYKIKLIDISGIKEKPVFSERTTQLKYVFTDFIKLNEGRYRVEICSLYTQADGEKESVYTRSDFFISLPNLSIPKILTPGKIYVE
ncbi:iron dicitrate transport regulator FecR [Leptospira ognonensis]|uniref:Iron dicitrate transport regulator FecR n=1 Tax=Leptospira ognonensis TaxID=2484945 RepID=A0A4R9KFF0_9LEPT|nr:FecR family protein [Leptospira ognonensis]TGL63983.1 iron dicitrate transport regulator FecR [Leptospira ognonensis]